MGEEIGQDVPFVVGCDISKEHLELSNADKTYRMVLATDDKYIRRINELCRKESIDMVHAQPDIEVLKLSANRNSLVADTFLPRNETIALCSDKYVTNQVLRRDAVPVPKAVKVPGDVMEDTAHLKAFSDSLADYVAYQSADTAFWVRARHGAGSRASLPANSTVEVLDWITWCTRHKGMAYEDFMVSEFLPGREYAWQSLWRDGKLVTSMGRQRLEYLFGNITPSGQSSSPSIARTVHNEAVNAVGRDAVLAVDKRATGVFCIDMKENTEGTPCVTEINAGRFFTTSNFFAEAGCNMPKIYTEMCMYPTLEPHGLPQYDAVPADLYWVRMIDCGHKLVPEHEWRSGNDFYEGYDYENNTG
jgi:carbamoyl-phosphate synthase large subunit